MVGISDLSDVIVYRKHLSQIYFREPSILNVDLDDREAGNKNPGDLLTDETATESGSMALITVPVM